MYYLIGAGGHAKVVIEILENQHLLIGGLSDSNRTITELLNYPVKGEFGSNDLDANDLVIISIGDNRIRKIISERHDYSYGCAIHSNAIISGRTHIGDGTVIMPGVIVNSSVMVGKHCILNTNASIDHDCEIGNYVHLSPNCTLAGDVNVGDGAHIGIGACILPGVKIGKWAIIGAGAVIVKDVPDFAVVVGVPGKIIKYINKEDG